MRSDRHIKHQDSKRQIKGIGISFHAFLFAFYEIVLHIHMNELTGNRAIYTLFGLAFGFGVSAFVYCIPGKKAQPRAAWITAMAAWLIYCAEITARTILQTYYPASMLDIAAENKLYQFWGIIVSTVLDALPCFLLMLLPALLMIIFAKKIYDGKRAKLFGKIGCVWVCIALAAASHALAVSAVNRPTEAEFGPKELYSTDTYYNDQVEQLGLCTMLRLDIQHQIVPPSAEGDFSGGQAEEVAEPNIMNIDLEAMAQNETNSNLVWLANYFNSVTPTNKNEYTGMFEGYNVVFVCMEAFSGYAISPEVTPNIYKLANEGFVFNNFYTALHYTSTSNGECQCLLGLYPKNGNPVSMSRTGQLKTDVCFTLANQLNKLGYKSYGYHNNWNLYERMASHTNAGYNMKLCGYGFPYEKNGAGDLKWPQRDSYMMEQSVGDYINSEDPFNVYYITVSGHTPYSWHWVANLHKERVQDLPYSDDTKAYLATCAEVDDAVGILLNKLEEAGKLENTVVVLVPDHVPYTAIESLEELTGREFGSSEAVRNINESSLDFDVYKSSLIIWSGSMEEPVPVDKVCCQVDILPTLSNLLGLEYDSRMLAGSDIMSDKEGMVVFSSRCWKTDKGLYNRFTQTFTPAEGVEMSEEELEAYLNETKDLAAHKLDSTALIIENNFYKNMLKYLVEDTADEADTAGE